MQPLVKGSRWRSKQEFMAAVAHAATASGYSVRAYRSDTARLVVKCCNEGCEFGARLTTAKAKDGPGDPWVLRAVNLGHCCDGGLLRKRNYRHDVVMHSAGTLARDYEAPAAGGVQQLRDMVANHGALVLGASQARRVITDGQCATATAFVSELQLLPDYLRQLRAQDPHGECGDG